MNFRRNNSYDTNPVEALSLASLELLPVIGPTLSKMYTNDALNRREENLELFITEVRDTLNNKLQNINEKYCP